MLNYYKENKDKRGIKKDLINIVKNSRYGKTGYFWINDQEAKMIMHPIKPSLDGKNLANLKDSTGKRFFSEMVRISKSQSNGYVDYMWPKPGFDKPQSKVSYVKLFKQFNWVIGTGEYVEDFENELKNKLLSHIKNVRFGKSGYIFIIDYNSVYLSHARKDFIGKNAIRNNDAKNINKVIKTKDIDFIRSNVGISIENINEVIGKKVNKQILRKGMFTILLARYCSLFVLNRSLRKKIIIM